MTRKVTTKKYAIDGVVFEATVERDLDELNELPYAVVTTKILTVDGKKSGTKRTFDA